MLKWLKFKIENILFEAKCWFEVWFDLDNPEFDNNYKGNKFAPTLDPNKTLTEHRKEIFNDLNKIEKLCNETEKNLRDKGCWD